MKTTILRKLLLSIFIVSIIILTMEACKSKEKKPIIIEPTFNDINVDVSERPSGLSLGSYNLQKIFINNSELSKDDYIIRNNHFIFAYDQYGKLGAGKFTIKLIFDEGEKTYNITITDIKNPEYEYQLKEEIFFGNNQQIKFPVVKRNSIYQNYNCIYKVLNQNGDTLLEQQNVEKTSEYLILENYEKGNYKITVKIEKEDIFAKEFECNFTVVDSVNLSVKETIDSELLNYHSGYINLTYNEEKMAIQTYKKNKNQGIESRLAISYSYLNTIIASGYDKMIFKYYADKSNIFVIASHETTNNFEKFKTAKSHYSIDKCVEKEWTEIEISLENIKADYLTFLIFNDKDTNFYLKDIYFKKSDKTNLITKDNFSLWSCLAPANLNMTFNETETALEVTRLTDNVASNGLTSRNNIIYFSMDILRQKSKEGKKAFSYLYKANSIFTQSGLPKIMLYATTDIVPSLTGSFKTVEISNVDYKKAVFSLDELLNINLNAKYFAISIGGAKNSVINFKDFVFLNENEYNQTLLSIDMFDGNEIKNWKAINATATKISLDTTENSLKINLGIANAKIDGRNFVTFYSADTIKLAKKLGKTQLKFKYKVDSVFANSANKGIRIYGKTTNSQDVGAIDTGTAGVYIYSTITIFTASEWVEYTININDFLKSNEDINYLAMVIAGEINSEIIFKNALFI